MLGNFCERFSLHPKQGELTDFDTVSAFIYMWKENAEFDDRYAEAEKELYPPPAK